MCAGLQSNFSCRGLSGKKKNTNIFLFLCFRFPSGLVPQKSIYAYVTLRAHFFFFFFLVMKKLHPIHHQGLRIALGALRTSFVTSLYAESTRDIFEKQSQDIVYYLCFKAKKKKKNVLTILLIAVFLNHQTFLFNPI